MIFTVRGVSDWLWAKPFWLLAILASRHCSAAYGQTTNETPQQTNEKIQQLATLARAHPVDTPIGSGDLLHIDVFDVPELSRDVRVGDGGDISYPLIPGKIAAAGSDAVRTGREDRATADRERSGVASAGFRIREESRTASRFPSWAPCSTRWFIR